MSTMTEVAEPQANPMFALFASEPSFAAEQALTRIEASFASFAAMPRHAEMLENGAGASSDDFWPSPDSWEARYRPYVVVEGVLYIPVKGVLLHNFSYTVADWITGYDYIWRAWKRGMEDANVRAIALICDSPGGMVAGCFATVKKMMAAKSKPVRGFAYDMAYSACYAVITTADTVVMSDTAGVGSIGVITGHVDQSKLLDRVGLKYTWITAPKGGHKADGNSTEPLKPETEARIQARIDELYDVFVASVVENRPVLTDEAVRATKALTFTATQATSNGLADAVVGSLDDALSAFAADLDDPSDTHDGDSAMADQATTTVDQAVHESAVNTARSEGHTAGKAEGLTEGAAAERTRINAIIGSDEGKKRPKAALSAALKSDMSVEAATAFLADLAEEAPAAAAGADAGKPDGKSPFDAAMDGTGNPDIKTEGKGGKPEAKDDGSDVIALARQCGLPGFAAAA